MSLTCNGEAPQIRQVPKPRRRIVATIPIKHDLYLHTCARIRGISLTALLTRLVDLVGQDQLVASVLDDADEIKVRRKGEHRYLPLGRRSTPATLSTPPTMPPES